VMMDLRSVVRVFSRYESMAMKNGHEFAINCLSKQRPPSLLFTILLNLLRLGHFFCGVTSPVLFSLCLSKFGASSAIPRQLCSLMNA
jgi:hypothetical protein